MAIHLIRHAKAGSRHKWEQKDSKRPLSSAGAEQAEALAEQLRDAGITRLVSSPALRCHQTLEPLGRQLGLDVTVESALAEGGSGAGALDALEDLAAMTPELAACSHGDVIPRLVQLLADRGIPVEGDTSLPKAGRVLLDLEGNRVVSARTFPPP